MTLTDPQKLTLKNFILGDVTLNAFPNTEDGADSIAKELNKIATPDFTVWRTDVPMGELIDNIVVESLRALPVAEGTALQTLVIAHDTNGLNVSVMSTRDVFLEASGNSAFFTGGQSSNPATRTQLTTLFKRLALLIEQVFADTTNGNGADATPAKLTFEGTISRQDVFAARSS